MSSHLAPATIGLRTSRLFTISYNVIFSNIQKNALQRQSPRETRKSRCGQVKRQSQPLTVLSLFPPNHSPNTHPQCIIIGAGLGGLAAGIGLLLAGHNVHILEGASQIGEIGAGIQVLPNSSRCLLQFGLEAKLAPYATSPSRANMLGWKGEKITSMDFEAATDEYGTPFWDFHRADLHRALLERAEELGAEFEINARVVDVEFDEQGDGTATAVLADGRRRTADLIVGADGLHSRCREILLGKPSPPTPTGDLAYRLLLDTKEMREDEEIAPFLDGHEVRYWMGPGAHAGMETVISPLQPQ